MNDGTWAPIRAYFDREGRLAIWPARSRRDQQTLALRWLASAFEVGRDYREAEVNTILRTRHTFDDHALLRRELIEAGLLLRTPDGSRYWRAIEAL